MLTNYTENQHLLFIVISTLLCVASVLESTQLCKSEDANYSGEYDVETFLSQKKYHLLSRKWI